jgi:subtilisin family serine protease
LNNEYNYGTTGAGVVVYVLDSGLANVYQEFGGRVLRQRNFARRPDQTVNSLDVLDYRNHGTPVASIIGGNTYGVAKGVQFVNLKVFGEPSDINYPDDVISAIDWMIADHQVYGANAVANYSGMAEARFPPLEEAVIRAINAGITFVVSAGNNARDACANSPAVLGSPNQWPNNPNGHSTITVGATTSTDAMASYSASGPCVDIYAPGDNVNSMGSNGQPIAFGGTSASAPFVAGVAARHLEAYPTSTPGVIQSIIKDHGTPQTLSGLGANSYNLLLYSGIVRRRACCAYP